MTPPLALGIDVGTGGVRCAALATDGRVVALSDAKMTEAGANPRAPEVWKTALHLAITRLCTKIMPESISAVAVDGTSGTVLALDCDGQPTGAVYMYNEPVEDAGIVDAIAAHAPRASAAHGPNSGLARAMALQNRPCTARVVHQADWIASLIAGAPVPSDESNALKTGYDPVARRWPAWLAQTGLRPGLLPRVVPVGTRTGLTSGAFGLPRNVPLVAGLTDGCASFLATGASEPGEGVTALGTTLTIKLLSERPVFAPEFGIYSHRIGDTWLAGGASNSGGGALALFFLPEEIETLSAEIDPIVESGLDYYPLMRPGERFPINDPDLPPRVSPQPDDPSKFLHGLFEGIARIEAMGFRRLAELGAPPLRRIRTVGGGSANRVWEAIRLRHLRVSAAPPASEAAAAGAARLALGHLAPV